MKTAEQIQAAIDRLLHDKDLSGDRMHSATSEAEKELIRTENFARDIPLVSGRGLQHDHRRPPLPPT